MNANTRRLLRCLLDDTTTSDIVPVMAMPSFKIKSLRDKEDDEEDDEGKKKDKVVTGESRLIVDALSEDCPCDIIPASATPVDSGDTGKKPEDKAERNAPPTDDALKVVLGGSDSKEPVDVPKFESKMTVSREDMLHRMVYLTSPKHQKRLQEEQMMSGGAKGPVISATAICHSVGAVVPSAAMPTGKDEDAEKTLNEASVADLSTVVASASTEGIPMPEHKAGDGKRITEAFRKFARAK